MDAREVLIAWTPRGGSTWPTQGQLLVTDQDPKGEKADGYMKTTGGQNTFDWRDASDEELGLRLLRLALQMIVKDGLEPAVVYDALAEVDQFAQAAHPQLQPGDWPSWLSEGAVKAWERNGK